MMNSVGLAKIVIIVLNILTFFCHAFECKRDNYVSTRGGTLLPPHSWMLIIFHHITKVINVSININGFTFKVHNNKFYKYYSLNFCN